MQKTLRYQEWVDKYHPNRHNTAPFTTRPPCTELNKTWSLIRRFGDMFIVPGVVGNAIAYASTVNPYTTPDTVYLPNDLVIN